jgi:hypothetical protein
MARVVHGYSPYAKLTLTSKAVALCIDELWSVALVIFPCLRICNPSLETYVAKQGSLRAPVFKCGHAIVSPQMLMYHHSDACFMPKDGDAIVTPNQPWTQDGSAYVEPVPQFPEPTPRTMPLDNRTAGTTAIRRADFPLGLVIIPHGHEPTTSPATLPVKTSSGSEVLVDGRYYVDFPDGFVIWFIGD